MGSQSPQQPATLEKYFDGDVLSNIFLRLPAKQLAQMRCVSKPWSALLSQPYFIKSHLNRSLSFYNKYQIYLGFKHLFYFDKPFTAIHCRTPDCQLPDLIIKPPHNAPMLDAACSVIGSVNGLICFVDQSDPTPVIHIWNPSLSALLPLSPYTIIDGIQFRFRFGFDPKTDDYKVVKLAFRPGLASGLNFRLRKLFVVVKEWLQVEVYSMRKGLWKFTTQSFPAHITRIYNDEDEVCVDGHDGHLHWLGYLDEEMKQQTIVAFDLGAETFGEISLPDRITVSNMHRRNALGVLGGKLCVISHIIDSEYYYEVWLMNEYGVTESWVKHHLFSQFIVDLGPLKFTLYNEFHYDPCYRNLSLYDTIVAKVKSSKIRGLIFYHGVKFVKYVDSLVWVAPANSGSAVAASSDCEFGNSTQKAQQHSSDAGPSTSRVADVSKSVIDDDVDELDELEASLCKTSIQIREPGK